MSIAAVYNRYYNVQTIDIVRSGISEEMCFLLCTGGLSDW